MIHLLVPVQFKLLGFTQTVFPVFIKQLFKPGLSGRRTFKRKNISRARAEPPCGSRSAPLSMRNVRLRSCGSTPPPLTFAQELMPVRPEPIFLSPPDNHPART